MRHLQLAALIALLPGLFLLSDDPESGLAASSAPGLRRPSDIDLSPDGSRLYISLESDGNLIGVDPLEGRMLFEENVGQTLSAVAAIDDAGHIVVADRDAHALVLLRHRGEELLELARLPVARYPVDLALSADGRRLAVSSLWSRRLSLFDLRRQAGEPPRLVPSKVIDLDFAPRRMIHINQGNLLVADSFGGRLALVDPRDGSVRRELEIKGQNIRGLALSPDGQKLFITHQHADPRYQSTLQQVNRGLFIVNNMLEVWVRRLIDPEQPALAGHHRNFLAEPGRSAADPAELAIFPDGQQMIALAGVGKVFFGHEDESRFRQLRIGGRPTRVVADAERGRGYILDRSGEKVFVVDLESKDVVMRLELERPEVLSTAERGEQLFHDATLSHNGWMSCHSCHSDGHSTQGLVDNESDGGFGSPKRVLSTLGAGASGPPWAWDGSVNDLPQQVRNSVLKTMRGSRIPEDDVFAIAAFVNSLETPPSVTKARGLLDADAVARGAEIFQESGCKRCHAPPVYTTAKTADVGLEDEDGLQRFNPPSLRGVGQRDRLFHDGRASSIDEVLQRFQHQLEKPLSEAQRRDLIAFLESL